MKVKQERPRPMSPRKLFAFIRERRRRSAQHSTEEGAQITRRLQELLAAAPTQEVDTISAKARSENDPTSDCDVGRLHWSLSEQGGYVGYPASDRREF
jgi:hypothetical protein